ncbi:helix-turn-helix domain-containing protein [Marinobacter zhejiangensis]|uniref:AraC-type DNA-binding protein n=1 Tax=Marinobacter zhejiangensis TaxID=488535 RepID=A0A1I4QBD4_9GAMM|nr:helix-turn-helix domain-containing protein [Marinobacter zhejiangensis]SFM36940.1 AraC-type DNA-binding protein [Marinobacter zhejiangensis]
MDAQPLRPQHLLYLWERRTLHIALIDQPVELEPAAALLAVSLGGALQYQTVGMPAPKASVSLLLAPGSRVALAPGADGAGIATCYLDALGQDYSLLAGQMVAQANGTYCELPREEAFQALFLELQQRPLSSSEAYQRLEAMINPYRTHYAERDSRVDAAVTLIRNSVQENLSVDVLAGAVNLSVPRLVQLFREQVGVPIRRYRQWHRLYVTAENIAGGQSLTDAAIGAGFTDSAHFSHTFRTILGVRPSDIFAAPDQVRIIIAKRQG